MALDAQLKEVRGGNPALWLELLGPAVVWAVQFQLTYALVPWSCRHGAPWLPQVCWIPFLAGNLVLGAVSYRHWCALCASAGRGVERACFMAAVGLLGNGMFSLLILLQGIATFVFEPCLK